MDKKYYLFVNGKKVEVSGEKSRELFEADR